MAAKQFFLPYPVAFTANGLPAAGAKLFFYLTGTLTLTDVYTTSGLTIAHTNPVVANGAGRFPTIYTDDAVNLRLIIKDADGETLDDIDPYIPGTAGSPGTAAVNPVFTAATGIAGSSVTLTGTYPNLLLTVPRGAAGSSGALSDGVLGVMTVSGGGTSLSYNDNSMALIKLVAAANAGFIGATGAGNYGHRTVAQVKSDLSISAVTDTTFDLLKDVPITTSTGARAMVLTDRNQCNSNTTGGWTIPSNASIAFPVGSVISGYNDSAVSQTLAITTDTLRLSGTATTGSRTVAQRGRWVAHKVKTTEWLVSGDIT